MDSITSMATKYQADIDALEDALCAEQSKVSFMLNALLVAQSLILTASDPAPEDLDLISAAIKRGRA